MEFLTIINLETGVTYIEVAPVFISEDDYSDNIEIYLKHRFGSTNSISWGVTNSLEINL